MLLKAPVSWYCIRTPELLVTAIFFAAASPMNENCEFACSFKSPFAT